MKHKVHIVLNNDAQRNSVEIDGIEIGEMVTDIQINKKYTDSIKITLTINPKSSFIEVLD